MQRNENESFEDYKARRKEGNQAVKDINKATKNAGKGNTREHRINKGVVAYSYGNLLRNHFAKKILEKIKQRKGK